MYRVLDLFSGAGGLSLGFKKTGKFEIIAAAEINDNARETYIYNHSDVYMYDDVTTINYSELIRNLGNIDVVIGGPPCQGFSNANRQKNTAISLNNRLVKEYIRAVKELNPKAFIMENVAMIKSDVHRFYFSEWDKEDNDILKIKMKESKISLLSSKYMFDNVAEVLQNEVTLKSKQWDDNEYNAIYLIYKYIRNIVTLSKENVKDKNKKKLSNAHNKHRHILQKFSDRYLNMQDRSYIDEINYELAIILNNRTIKRVCTKKAYKIMEKAISIQKMFKTYNELKQNHIEIKLHESDKGLYAVVKSYSVIDYIKLKLGDYQLTQHIYNALDYGTPQRRERFILVGSKLIGNVKFKIPDAKYGKGKLPYFTVEDAISDIADVDVVYKVDDPPIRLKEKKHISKLALQLRDSEFLYNHISTKSTDVAIERFKQLKQGENFHALKAEYKDNTYTNSERTQNTIYQRLDYSKPSGTVVNVRKSMWIHPIINRAVSIREAARLQTFPDSFVFYGTKDSQYQQIGNAVPPFLAKAVAEALADFLDNLAK